MTVAARNSSTANERMYLERYGTLWNGIGKRGLVSRCYRSIEPNLAFLLLLDVGALFIGHGSLPAMDSLLSP